MMAIRSALALASAVLLLSACHREPTISQARPAIVIQADAIGGDVEAFAGELTAREAPVLAFRIAGKITRRFVDAGAQVRAGQALAELDSADVALQAQAAQAQLASATSELTLAAAEMERYQGLLARQLVSRSAFENRQAIFKSAEAQVRQARAQAQGYNNQSSYAVLRAPQNGVISQRLAEAGQVVAAGQPVFVLAVEGEREVSINIPENSIQQFTVGRELLVEIWAMPGKRYPGRLRELSPVADALTRTYAARVAIGNVPELALGQSARVYAQQPGKLQILLPLSAIRHDVTGEHPAVWVVTPSDSKVHLTPVKTGRYGEDGVAILSGISDGTWVVAAGVHLLHEGDAIATVDRDNRPVRMTAVDKTP